MNRLAEIEEAELLSHGIDLHYGRHQPANPEDNIEFGAHNGMLDLSGMGPCFLETIASHQASMDHTDEIMFCWRVRVSACFLISFTWYWIQP